jgi:cysteine-rich secretory family protein
MKAICLAFALAVGTNAFGLAIGTDFAQAEDMAAMISQYRREHGLPAVKIDSQFTAVAQRQAQAMARAGVMDHDVAGPFASRISGANTDSAGENIAVGTKTWADTLRMWKASPGHNANLLRPDADRLGVAVAYNDQTRYKAFWAMVIGHKAAPADRERLRAGDDPPADRTTRRVATETSPLSWLTKLYGMGRKALLGE